MTVNSYSICDNGHTEIPENKTKQNKKNKPKNNDVGIYYTKKQKSHYGSART